MKIKLLIIALMLLVATPVVMADFYQTQYSSAGVQFLRIDPVIIEPAQNFNLYFIVNNIISTQNPTPLQFQLNPTFPLQLAPGETGQRSFANVVGNTSIAPILLQFSMYVNPNATQGSYNVELRYSTNNWVSYNSVTQNITVQNVATDFDVVEQDVSGNTVTLGLSNIGQNVANAVTFTIPQQTDFTVQGVNSNIIGNLNPGDFTLVSFSLEQTGSSQLLAQVSYTDTAGTRRTVEKLVLVTFVSASATAQSQRSSGGNIYLLLAAVAITAVVFYFIGRRFGKKVLR